MKKLLYILFVFFFLSSFGLKKENKAMDDLKLAIEGKKIEELVDAWGKPDYVETEDAYLELTQKIISCATSATWNSVKVKFGNCNGKASFRFINSATKANNYEYEIAEGVECK